MKTKLKQYSFFLLLILTGLQTVFSRSAADIKTDRNPFLGTLEAAKLELVKHTFEDCLGLIWNNLPIGLASITGLEYRGLGNTSRIAFHRLLTIVLSSQVYLKVMGIM